MSDELTIGKVAKQAGVNIQTIRFYERRGILLPAGRRSSGYRLYMPDAVQKIQFIKNAQELGFSLEEIIGLLKLKVSRTARCPEVKKRALSKLRDVEGKIKGLTSIQKVLKDLVESCQNNKTTDHCPILGALEVHKKQ